MGTFSYLGTSALLGNNRYFQDFGEEVYGTNGTMGTDDAATLGQDLAWATDKLHEELRSTGRFSVFPLQRDNVGEYPQWVEDYTANLVIHSKLMANFQAELDEIPESISYFGTQVDIIIAKIETGDVLFDTEVDVGEIGIGRVVLVGTLGTLTRGTLFNNHNGYPFDPSKKFNDNTYPRTWIIDIIVAGGIGTAEFTWSKDANVTEAATLTTELAFQQLSNYVYVRFASDDLGSNVFTVGDNWKFNTVPLQQRRVFGSNEGVSVSAGRTW